MILKRFLSGILIIGLLFFQWSCSVISTKPIDKTGHERILGFPDENIPVTDSVTIYWNKNMIPFIHAKNDADGAFVLGMVHAHLRLGQMEVFRMMAQGRLAEIGGPFVADIDHAFRILQLDMVVDEIVNDLPEETRLWVTNFVEGINFYQEQMKELPIEFRLLNIKKRKWTVRDLYAVSRLVAIDLSWMTYVQYLMLMEHDEWKDIYQQYITKGQQSIPSFHLKGPVGLMNILNQGSKSGSNSIVVSGDKSVNSSALIANDPHLGIFAPNIWLLVGYKTPSYHTVGMQIAGLPFMALGRNLHIAWGGTNMRSLSSHLYQLDAEELTELKERNDTIKVRWWPDKTIKIRDSKFGPVISDAPFFKHIEKPVAIKWLGHQKSFELTAFLKSNRAKNFEEFRQAFKSYAVSGQNMVYADNDGNIGQVLAYRQPVLKQPVKTLDLLKKTDNPITSLINSTELAYIQNPEKGFIASANNQPVVTEIPIGLQYTGKNRMKRMHELVESNGKVSVNLLKELQTDVMSYTNLEVKNKVVDKVRAFEAEFRKQNADYWNVFTQFDGNYHKESRGPVAFETLMYFVTSQLVEKKYKNKDIQESAMNGDNWVTFVNPLIEEENSENLKEIVLNALKKGYKYFKKYKNWGEMHQIEFGAAVANIPGIGKKYLIKKYGVSGTSHTLMKTAHNFSPERERVTYGSNSRHISDMSDIDKNYFVLLGGQDGWISSPFNSDQLELWEKKEYIRFPLRVESIKEEFNYHVSRIKSVQ